MEASPIFERRPERSTLVSVRVSLAERIELERLARKAGATISDVLRDGLAQVRRVHQDAETVCGNE
jgi:hypothetical protein